MHSLTVAVDIDGACIVRCVHIAATCIARHKSTEVEHVQLPSSCRQDCFLSTQIFYKSPIHPSYLQIVGDLLTRTQKLSAYRMNALHEEITFYVSPSSRIRAKSE